LFNYAVKRVLQLIPVLLLISILVFSLVYAIPGDPARMLAPPDASDEEIDRIAERLGLHRPLPVQYADWFVGVLQGDWGNSISWGRPVLPDLLRRLPATLQLAALSVLFSVGVAIPVGVLSATRQNSFIDSISRVASLLGLSMPNFWVGMMLILLFALHLRLLPASGRRGFEYLILPAITLGTSGMATIMRVTRSTMLEVIRQDYVRTARSKGLPERVVIYKHTLRNALIAVITVIGLQMGFRLGGTVVIERVFAYPGLGQLAYQGMMHRDTPMIMGNLMLFATMFCLINLVVDLIYAFVDPRIRYG